MNGDLLELPTDTFIDNIRELAQSVFDCAFYPQENISTEDWARLVEAGVLLPAIPREFGGRDSHIEMCRVVEAIAEWNLPLAMYVKIITAVALRPIVMRGSEQTRHEVLPEFSSGKPMICGFASTEPECGSGMAAMSTTFEEVDGGYRVFGRKHWQGFSATAHWWLVSAKNDDDGRRYGYFVVRRSEGFATVRRYTPIGMKVLDYGLNEIDAVIPEHRRLNAHEGDLSAMVELLMPPRSMMAALAAGFLRRISREAHTYAENRPLGRKFLVDIRFVRYRLRAIEASTTICEALKLYLETNLDLKADMQDSFPAVQAIKTVATENMVSSANHYQQIVGGEGYRCGSPTNVAAQAFLDTRVFTIFDGTNDLLSQQLTQYCQKRLGDGSMSSFLATWELTAPAVQQHAPKLIFLDQTLDQEHCVLAGRAIAYLFAISQVMAWAKAADDVANRAYVAIEFLKADIAKIAAEFELLAEGVLD